MRLNIVYLFQVGFQLVKNVKKIYKFAKEEATYILNLDIGDLQISPKTSLNAIILMPACKINGSLIFNIEE
jgi:hypothetical protein